MARARPLVILLAAAVVPGSVAQAGEDEAARLYADGYDALQEDRVDDAEKLLSQCIVVDPASADCWWGLGLVSWKREAWSRALRQWEQVQRIDPNHAHLDRWLPKAREKVALLAAPTTPVAPEATAAAGAAPTPVATTTTTVVATAAPTTAAPTAPPTVATAAPTAVAIAAPVTVAATAPTTVATVATVAPTTAPPAPAPAPTVVVASAAPVTAAPTAPLTGDPDGGAVLAQADVAVQDLDASKVPVTVAPTVVATVTPTAPVAPPAPAPTVTVAPTVVATAAPTPSVAPPAPAQTVTAAPTVVATAPTVAPTVTVAPPSGVATAPTVVASATAAPPTTAPLVPAGFDWSGTWHFGECWTTAAGFDACIDHAVKIVPKDGALYAEYDADGYQTMTRFLCKVVASGDEVELVHVQDRPGNVFAGNPGEVVVRLHQQNGTVEATLPGETDERLLARKDR
jgi:hypothetical protein